MHRFRYVDLNPFLSLHFSQVVDMHVYVCVGCWWMTDCWKNVDRLLILWWAQNRPFWVLTSLLTPSVGEHLMTPMVRGLSQPENMKTDHQQFVFKLWVLYANLPATKYVFDQSGNGEKNLKRPAGRGRPKKASSCHCGCEKRMDRAWILGSYVFATLYVFTILSAQKPAAHPNAKRL